MTRTQLIPEIDALLSEDLEDYEFASRARSMLGDVLDYLQPPMAKLGKNPLPPMQQQSRRIGEPRSHEDIHD